MTPKRKPLRKSSGRSSNKSTNLGRVLVESAKEIARHIRGEIELPMKVVRVAPEGFYAITPSLMNGSAWDRLLCARDDTLT